MLSDAAIKDLAPRFIWVKVDPRSPGSGRSALEHKSTRYVPEVVFLDPDGEPLEHLERPGQEWTAEAMKEILSRLESRSR